MAIEIKKLPASEIEITGEIAADVLESNFPKALKKIGGTVEIDGFRKGKVPENVLLAKVPEIRILEEAAEMALAEEYPKIIEAEKLDPIGRPEIFITKLARKNPLGFRIKTAVLPEIKLPDYASLARKTVAGLKDEDTSTAVSDEDVENTIMDIRKSRAPKIHMADAAAAEGDEKKEEVKEELPELNDEFVQSLGPFTNVADFRDKLKQNIRLEKENMVREKTRLKIIEAVIEKSKMELPALLVESELDKIMYRMESDITQMGLKFEDYLKHMNKSAEDIRKEFRSDAEKKAKLALVLAEIAKQEHIKADPEAVAQEVAHLLEHYKDADPERAAIHAENVLTNEKVFAFLESQK